MRGGLAESNGALSDTRGIAMQIAADCRGDAPAQVEGGRTEDNDGRAHQPWPRIKIIEKYGALSSLSSLSGL